MSEPTKASEEQGPQAKQPTKADRHDLAIPGSLAWIRQITLWQIVKNPDLVKYYPRLFLEKPWLSMVLFASVGLVLGIISGVQEGRTGGIEKGIEAAAVCSFVACVLGAIVVSPVSLVLWLIRLMAERSARQKPFDPSQRIVRIGPDCVEFEHQRFSFRPNRIISVFMLLLVSGGEAVFCCMAILDNNAWFFVMAVLCVIGPLGMGVSIFRAFFGKESVVLTDTEIILPKVNRLGLYTGVICVDFRDVTDVRVGPFGVIVQHRQGEFLLQNFMFPARRIYDAVVALLTDSVARNHENAMLNGR